jgi:hypothetical protein
MERWKRKIKALHFLINVYYLNK